MAEPKRGQPVTVSRVDVPKASGVLAEQLRERILSGEIPEGTSLPAERDLVTQTGLSRTTVREALRMLEVQGLVRIRPGRSGGAYVQQPGQDSIANSVSLVIRGRRIRLRALMEMREALEPYCAELAAQRRTEHDLAAMDAAIEAIRVGRTLPQILKANVDWHVAVAEASDSELLAGFMSALAQAIYTSTENPTFVDEEVRRTAHRAHSVITAAIRDGDAAAARRRMERHVHGYATAALEAAERIDRTEIEVPDDAPRSRTRVARPAASKNGAAASKAKPARVAKGRGATGTGNGSGETPPARRRPKAAGS